MGKLLLDYDMMLSGKGVESQIHFTRVEEGLKFRGIRVEELSF